MTDIHSLLHRGVLEIIDQDHLQQRLESGDKLRVKYGIDASKPDLHIGHAVPLRKLKEFQDAGHTAILLLGDYTAQLGDPADRNESRTLLSAEETTKNAQAYLDQVFQILDKTTTEVRYNSEWYNNFSMRDVIELISTTTLNHLLSHETFQQRINKNIPLYMQEIIYPIMQGYDSVELRADIELGGIDQKFNLLMGRMMQRAHGMPEQDVMLFPYLPGTNGQDKMSKSLGNTINLTDAPHDMFGKVMSIPDPLMPIYFELATQSDSRQLEAVKVQLEDPTINPKTIKEELAQTIVAEYYGPKVSKEAREAFNKQFSQKQTPDTMETLVLKSHEYDLSDLLVNRSTLIASKNEFRRLVQQKGIKKNGSVVTDPLAVVTPEDGETVIQVGSRRFLKLTWK
jgi:tyrosyl-tRNA synthetase